MAKNQDGTDDAPAAPWAEGADNAAATAGNEGNAGDAQQDEPAAEAPQIDLTASEITLDHDDATSVSSGGVTYEREEGGFFRVPLKAALVLIESFGFRVAA